MQKTIFCYWKNEKIPEVPSSGQLKLCTDISNMLYTFFPFRRMDTRSIHRSVKDAGHVLHQMEEPRRRRLGEVGEVYLYGDVMGEAAAHVERLRDFERRRVGRINL